MTHAYWSIIVAFVMIYVPRGFGIAGQFAMDGGFDFAAPRDQQMRLAGIARRGQAAHLNGVEGFAPFAVAVWMALQTGADGRLVNELAMGYAAARVMFVFAYLVNLNPYRTIIWIGGMMCNVALFAIAADAGLRP